jgi:hypothetical protein
MSALQGVREGGYPESLLVWYFPVIMEGEVPTLRMITIRSVKLEYQLSHFHFVISCQHVRILVHTIAFGVHRSEPLFKLK